ncbi:MAG: hypothetical protein WA239_15385, partial [Candidatus Sulfotelmatobacter sp.]
VFEQHLATDECIPVVVDAENGARPSHDASIPVRPEWFTVSGALPCAEADMVVNEVARKSISLLCLRAFKLRTCTQAAGYRAQACSRLMNGRNS